MGFNNLRKGRDDDVRAVAGATGGVGMGVPRLVG